MSAEASPQIALERALDRNVEVLLLNRAPATVCAAAIDIGKITLASEHRQVPQT